MLAAAEADLQPEARRPGGEQRGRVDGTGGRQVEREVGE
jgi:hypothetical protein